MVLYQFMVTCIENFTSKVDTWGLSVRKKRFKIVILYFHVVYNFPEKKGMDLWKQMSSSFKCSFIYIAGFFALKPFHNYSLCLVCILPQPAFYSQSAVFILHTVCIIPLVRSLQSTVCILHWPVLYLDINGSITLIWAETERYNIVCFSKMTVMNCITQQPCWIKNLVI